MTRADLLAAVTAAPDDDTPRLAFADYLEDEGDTNWADLIRLQIGFFRDWTNFPEVKRRELELIAATRYRFTNPPGCELGPPVRGFPESVRIKNVPDPDYAAAFAWPVSRIHTPYHAPQFPTDYYARAEVLELLPVDATHPGRGHRLGDFNDLPKCRPDRLRLLIWRRSSRESRLAYTVAAVPQMAGLTELDLSDSEIDDAGGRALAESPYLGNLGFLNLARTGIRDFSALERRFGSALRTV